MTSANRMTIGRALALSASMALIATALEFVAAGVILATSNRPLYQGMDVIWAKPLANLVGIVPLALIAWRFSRRLFELVLIFPVVAAPLIALRPGSAIPLMILSAGVAVQARRLLARDERHANVIRTGSVLAFTAVMAVVISTGWRIARGRTTGTASSVAGAPNVLLLILDTVRRASLSDAGGKASTPFLDSLGASGVVFDRAVSPSSWTLPSHASMFTGRWPQELSAGWEAPLDGQVPTLAEVLARGGYATGGFVANMIYMSREHGLDRGFHEYRDYRRTPGAILQSAALWHTVFTAKLVRRLTGFHDVVGRKHAADVNREFLKWVDGKGASPWFGFLNYFDAHEPYLPRPPFAGRYSAGLVDRPLDHLRFWNVQGGIVGWESLDSAKVTAERAAYEETISGLDEDLRQLFTALQARGKLENTIIVVTSDHGELFGEHNAFGHGGNLYLRSIHVPLMIVWPGHLAPGQRVAMAVSLRDLAATIESLARPGVRTMPGQPLAGPDAQAGVTSVALSELLDPSGEAARADIQSILSNDWQFVWSTDGGESAYRVEKDWSTREIIDSVERAAVIDSGRALRAAAGVRVLPPRP